MKIDHQEILAQVKANLAKLDGCASHEFDPPRASRPPLTRDVTCMNCGGTVDWHGAHWYETGRQHERAAADRQGAK